MAVAFTTNCTHDEPDMWNISGSWDGSVPFVDVTPPTVTVYISSVDITGVEEIRISDNELYVGDKLVASWTDNVTKNCKVRISFDGVVISSGEVARHSWTLSLVVTDDAGNSGQKVINLVLEEVFPELNILQPVVDIFGGVAVHITDTQMLIDDEVVVEWSDKRTEKCKVSMSLLNAEVKDGDILSQSWMLKLTVTNDDGMSSTAEIKLIKEGIYWLENLEQLSLMVDEEYDLLSGVSFGKGVELVKVVVVTGSGASIIGDPNHFTPDYPGRVSVLFTIEKGGYAFTVSVNLTIHPLEYKGVTFENSKFEYLPYYSSYIMKYKSESLTPYFIAIGKTAEFVRNWHNNGNSVHLLWWEYNDEDDPFWAHGVRWYKTYKAWRFNDVVCGFTSDENHNWAVLSKVIDYVKQFPNICFTMSNAIRGVRGNMDELRKLLEFDNVVLFHAIWNRGNEERIINNEDVQVTKEGDYWYTTTSDSSSQCFGGSSPFVGSKWVETINSKKNNKFTVTWYNKDDFYTSDFNSWPQHCYMGNWFPRKWNWNTIIKMYAQDYFIDWRYWLHETSSYPTAAAAAVFGNMIDVVMGNHPWITVPNALDIIDNYLIEKRMRFIDYNVSEEIQTWWFIYDVDVEKFNEEEVLHVSELSQLSFNSDIVELPSRKGVCYVGKWIQFEYNGEKYDGNNDSTFVQAIHSWETIKWYFSKDRFRKFGWTNSVEIVVCGVDKDCKLILDKTITKNVE